MQITVTITPPSGASMGLKQYSLAIRDVDTRELYASTVKYLPAMIPNNAAYELETTIDIPSTKRVEFTITPADTLTYSATLKQREVVDGTFTTTQLEYTGQITTASEVVMTKLMPEMDVIKFLKGLFQMFKLVVVGKEDNSFYVNSLDAYYLQGQRRDITKYVNYAQIDVERGEILGELDFKFADPSTILATQFKDNNGVGYGDSKVKLKDADGEPFDGDTLTVELPFETVVYERLTDVNGSFLTGLQIGSVMNYNYEPVFIKPHLHYASRLTIGSTNKIKFQGTDILEDTIFIPTVGDSAYNPTYSLLFESEDNSYTGDIINNTLYSHHYAPYIEAIFNIKRRTIKVEAKLPIQIITRLDLNDVITINSLDYRINSYKYNLLTGLTNLELINGFDKYETNELLLLDECFRASNNGGVYTFNIPFIQDYTITSTLVGGDGGIFVYPSTPEPNQLRLAVAPWGEVSGRGVDVWQRKTELTFTDSSGNSQGGMCIVQTNRGD